MEYSLPETCCEMANKDELQQNRVPHVQRNLGHKFPFQPNHIGPTQVLNEVVVEVVGDECWDIDPDEVATTLSKDFGLVRRNQHEHKRVSKKPLGRFPL